MVYIECPFIFPHRRPPSRFWAIGQSWSLPHPHRLQQRHHCRWQSEYNLAFAVSSTPSLKSLSLWGTCASVLIPVGDMCFRSVAWAVSALADRDLGDEGYYGLIRCIPSPASDGPDLPLALAELMLLCLATPSRDIADAALEYFATVNGVSE